MTECGAVSTQIILGLDEDERSTVEEPKEAPHKKAIISFWQKLL